MDEGKSTSEAAGATAIAAEITAQFASITLDDDRDQSQQEFTHDIDINDVRDRYLLARGSTQLQIYEETGASVSTRGVWYPDRSKATERNPPLYIHISAQTNEMLDKAVAKVNELIALDMGSLVEREIKQGNRKWPEETLPVGLELTPNFNRAKVVGPTGSFFKYIQAETGTRLQLKGLGSGFIHQETGQEESVPLYIHITGPDEGQVARAKILAEDLLLQVHEEHAKVQILVQQQQMEPQQTLAQYAAYSAGSMEGDAPPPPSTPPPPREGLPAPPSGTPAGDPAAQYANAGPPAPNDTTAYAAYASSADAAQPSDTPPPS